MWGGGHFIVARWGQGPGVLREVGWVHEYEGVGVCGQGPGPRGRGQDTGYDRIRPSVWLRVSVQDKRDGYDTTHLLLPPLPPFPPSHLLARVQGLLVRMGFGVDPLHPMEISITARGYKYLNSSLIILKYLLFRKRKLTGGLLFDIDVTSNMSP